VKKEYDLLFNGGMVVTGRGLQRADVAVRGEEIAAVGRDLSRDAARGSAVPVRTVAE